MRAITKWFYDLITQKKLYALAEEANLRSNSAPELLRLRFNNFGHSALMLAWSLDNPDATEPPWRKVASLPQVQGRIIEIGELCRAKCGAPARYIGRGNCLYISCQDNEFYVDYATPPSGDEQALPLPSDRDVRIWADDESKWSGK